MGSRRGSDTLEKQARARTAGAIGVLALGAFVAACAPQVGVSAEERMAIAVSTTTPSPPTTTPSLPTTTPSPPTTAPPAPPGTEPIDTVPAEPALDDESLAESGTSALLLMPGDLAGWSIGPPRTIGPNNYGPSDCSAVDVLRSIDERVKVMTQGSAGAVGFDNFLFEMESVEAATAIMDAVTDAPSACSQFRDGSGPSTVGPLSVPDASGWRAGGVIFGGSTNAAAIGYWQRDTTIVKLRVLGPGGLSEPGGMLAGKLTSFATGAPIPGPVETWQLDPLAASVLAADQLPPGWTRTEVQLIEPSPAGIDGPCGVVEPAKPGGIIADFDHGEIVLRQMIVRATPAVAQQWVDALRVVTSCADFGPLSEIDLVDAATIGADDLVGIAFDSDPGARYASNATVGARFGGVFVMITWGSPALADDGALTLDQAVALLAVSAPD